ncbi:MAG: NUDIX domain-containing protein [Phycisphaera sp.]|nr:NUDIX domain-containing protein [Phycisphaera sp.]
MPYTYEYPRPALTVDCVVFGFDDEALKLLLIQRGIDPYKGSWALPGGFVRMDETTETAAMRELEEEAGVSDIYLEQLYTFSEPNRDPRDRIVSVAHYALVKLSDHRVTAATDAEDVGWFPADDPPPLAFDHAKILSIARDRLRAKVRYQPVGFELLPTKFTLRQLQHLYEVVLGRELDKRNFRKKVHSLGILKALDEYETGVSHRAAQFFKFDRAKYRQLEKKGFNFEI